MKYMTFSPFSNLKIPSCPNVPHGTEEVNTAICAEIKRQRNTGVLSYTAAYIAPTELKTQGGGG